MLSPVSPADEPLPGDGARLRLLYRVAEDLVSNLRLSDLLPRILESLSELFRYDRCAVVGLSPGGGLEALATRPEGIAVPFSHTVGQRVLENGEALLFDDIQGQAPFSLGESVMGLNIRSVLCSPLVARGRSIGLLYLDRAVSGSYGAEDLALVRGVSAMVAVALENARLYGEVEGRYRDATQRLEAAEARLIDTERAAALGQLALSVADAVRNPVTVIGGLARRLQREAGHPEVAASAAAIRAEAESLERAMGRVEALVSLPRAQVVSADLDEVVTLAVADAAPAAGRAGQELALEWDGLTIRRSHDPSLTRMALAAILDHVCRSVPRGTRVHVSLRSLEGRPALVVQDSRCLGTAPVLRGAFEAGAAPEPWALDLGLALAERAMVAQGGDLRLGGRADTGICVYLVLPVAGG